MTRALIGVQKQKTFDIDEFEEIECDNCKHVILNETNGTTWIECELGCECIKEEL